MALISGREKNVIRIEDYAAELSRLETIMDGRNEKESDKYSSVLKSEISRGPLKTLLEEEEDPRLALLRAKAHVAAHKARIEMGSTQWPGWLPYTLKLLVLPLVLAVLVPPLVNVLTARQQLELYREQKSVEAIRNQANNLLEQLSSLAIEARELKASTTRVGPQIESLQDQQEAQLSRIQAALEYSKSIEVERKLRSAMELNDLEPYPSLRQSELAAYYELRALQDCLQTASGRTVDSTWKEEMADEVRDPSELRRLRSAASTGYPCGENFDASAFSTLTSAVNQEISGRIGGSLFPKAKASGASD